MFNVNNTMDIKSPNKAIHVMFNIMEGELTYAVKFLDTFLLQPSNLGINLRNHRDYHWQLNDSKHTYHKNSWEKVWGSSCQVLNEYNQLSLSLEDRATGLQMTIHFRLFDHGLAFRYEWPEQEYYKQLYIEEELTSFNIGLDCPCWFGSEVGNEPRRKGHSLNGLEDICMPLTLKHGHGEYLAIYETDVNSYSLATLHVSDGFNINLNTESIAELPHQSPWRVIQIGEQAIHLLEKHLVDNLNPPCEIEDTTWIRTGKSMWDWRNHGAVANGFTYGLNTDTMKRYIDFCSEHHLEYALIDSGWYGSEYDHNSDPISYISDMDVPYLADYAKDKGVGLLVYLNDIALKHYDIDRTLSTYKDWGISGIKHGFLASKGQHRVSFTRQIAKLCAGYKLLYIPHEPARPWGLHVTYPNYLACEFIVSQYDGPKAPAATPTYLCTVPFTNNLLAPLDRNCCMFELNNAITRDRVHKEALTTIASQLAQAVVISSGFLCLLDHPDSYNQKSDLFEFIRRLPQSFEESIAVNGEIAEYITIARRKGKDWFIGSQNNEDERDIVIPLCFLAQGNYEARIYSDGSRAHYLTNREDYTIKTENVNSNTRLRIKLAAGGGCAIRISPITAQ